MNFINRFIYGSSGNMDSAPLEWWNSKRKEYSVRFMACLLIGQALVLFLNLSYLTSEFTLQGTELKYPLKQIEIELGLIIGYSLPYILIDFVILVIVNILYFLLPLIEKYLFSKHHRIYRKSSFAFINSLNIFIVISCLCTTIYFTLTG